MSKADHVTMLECIPKQDNQDESELLWQLFRMTDNGATKFEVANKSDLLSDVLSDVDVVRATFVHVSCHGDGDEAVFVLPRGRVQAEEFPEGCFSGKVVTLSSCSLGRKEFINRFCGTTGAKVVVAPTYEVLFAEAAVFYVNFYFLVMHHKMTPRGAFDRAMSMVEGKVKGAFHYWS